MPSARYTISDITSATNELQFRCAHAAVFQKVIFNCNNCTIYWPVIIYHLMREEVVKGRGYSAKNSKIPFIAQGS